MKRKVTPKDEPAVVRTKADLRERVLAEIGADARVLHCDIGEGAMHLAVWSRAKAYAGCDERPWKVVDPPRFVAESARLLRTVDLGSWCVFDFEHRTQGWLFALLLAEHRRWAAGERGALFVTTSQRGRKTPPAMARLADGVGAPPEAGPAELIGLALLGFTKRAGVKALRVWQAQTKGALHSAVVFEGVAEPAAKAVGSLPSFV